MSRIKTIFLLPAVLLLASCASLKSQQARIAPTLLGQPASALTARYGRPLVMGNLLAYTVGKGTKVFANTSTVTGMVGMTPVTATVSSWDSASAIPTYCTIQVEVDEERIVRAVTLRGDLGECKGAWGA